MRHQNHILFILIISLVVVVFACKKSDEVDNGKIISLVSPTEIKETGFIAHWSTTLSETAELTIQLSLTNSFESVFKEITVANPSQTSQTIHQLSGATTYHYRIRAKLKDNSILFSEIKTVTTSYKTEEVIITTSDGIKLAARLKYLESTSGLKSGVIFMHELGTWFNNWQSSEVVTRLIAQNYACLILDFRGHFQSDDYPLPTDEGQVEQFINTVSLDLIASIEFMQNHNLVYGDQLALVGGSLGGIMAVAGNGYEEVKVTVAMSASRLGMFSIFPDLQISSAYFIAGEFDASGNTDFNEEAQHLFNSANEPKKLRIVKGSSEHGTNLLGTPGLNHEIIDWINDGIQ